jgi:hypothetical protein
MRDHLNRLAQTIREAWWLARSNQIVRNLHRPLRRTLEKYNALELLLAVYAYVQFIQFEVKLPAFLHYPALNEKTPRRTGLAEWELDVLCREAIAYSRVSGGQRIANYGDVSSAVNLIKRLEENIWRAYPHGQRDIIQELTSRSTHRQFPWQRPINHPAIGRYYKIYSDPKVEDVLKKVTGLSAIELFRVGVGLTGHFIDHPVLPIPAPAGLGVATPHIDAFLKRFATTFDDLRQRVCARTSWGINWAYTPNPLRDKPLIAGQLESGHCYVCPIPSFLLQRLTSGIYYELIDDDGFANPFGSSFQTYIGDVLVRVNSGPNMYQIFPEEKYGPSSRRKDTVDWIVEDATASLFVEVKAKRLAVQAKVDLESRDALTSQFEKLAEFVVQIYKTLKDALDGKYPHWKPSGRPIYPIVVTLEEWFPHGPIVHGVLDARVRELMAKANLDVGMIETMPYSVASADDFEMAIHVMAKRNICTVMADRTSNEKREWLLAAVLTDAFSDELQDAELFFPEIWNEIVPGGGD